MRVATVETSDSTVTVGVWIDAGSRYESRESNGAAHFLEHMTFKGTAKRTRHQLETEIENMGGHLNAYTSREQTVYYAKVFEEDLGRGVEILSDILGSSRMRESDIEAERSVILREMEEVEKTVEEVIFDRLHLTAFRDDPLGFTILGPVENIENLRASDLRKYVDTNYTTDRLVVVGVGAVNHEELLQHTEKCFSGFREKPMYEPHIPTKKPTFRGGELLYQSGSGGVASPFHSSSGMGSLGTISSGQLGDTSSLGEWGHFAIAFEGVGWSSEDSLTFMLMQTICGTFKREEGQSARNNSGNVLARNVLNRMEREQKALNEACAKTTTTTESSSVEAAEPPPQLVVESFSAFNTCYKDTGMFGVYGACTADALPLLVEELMFGINRLCCSVTSTDLERAKRELRFMLLSNLENTTLIAEDVGRHLLVYGRRISAEEMDMRLDAIDAEEVKRVATQYLQNGEIAVTALGAIGKMPRLAEIKQMAKLRCSE